MGKAIVSYSWVSRCLEAGRVVPTNVYEPKDTNGELGPQRSRIYHINGLGQRLFQVGILFSTLLSRWILIRFFQQFKPAVAV